MALNGIFYGTTANTKITPSIAWSAVQSVAGNYSDVTATLTYTKKGGNQTTGGRWTGTLTIGGDTKKVTSQYMEVSDGKPAEMMSHTVRIYHDSYGKCSVTISATGGIVNPSSATLQNTQISQTVTLDTIPRTSSVICTSVDVGQNPTITITRADGSFTHTLWYQYGELSETIAEKTKETTITSWTIPDRFYSQIPNAKSGVGILTCITYSGDTQIGTSTCKFTVTANEQTCRPEVSGTVVDTNGATLALTGDENVLVRYQSTAFCTIISPASEAAKNWASIREKSVNGILCGGNTVTIPGVDTGVFTFRAKDSRDYATEVKVEKSLVPYVQLTCRATATRIDPEGNARISIEGSYFSGSFGVAENALTLKYRPAGAEAYIPVEPVIGDGTYTAEIRIDGLDYTRDSYYEVVAEDKLCTVPITVTAGKGVPVFDWGETDFRFHVPVYMANGMQLFSFQAATIGHNIDEIYDSGTYYVAENTPGFPVGHGGILVVFGCKGICTVQLAMDYSGYDIRMRSNWHGTWHSWRKISFT